MKRNQGETDTILGDEATRASLQIDTSVGRDSVATSASIDHGLGYQSGCRYELGEDPRFDEGDLTGAVRDDCGRIARAAAADWETFARAKSHR